MTHAEISKLARAALALELASQLVQGARGMLSEIPDALPATASRLDAVQNDLRLFAKLAWDVELAATAEARES